MNSFHSRLAVPAALTEAERRLWDEWCEATPGLDNPFLTFTYASAAARIFPDTRVCVISQADEPVAFFPFQRGRGLNRLLGAGSRLGGELSDYFGVVARPGVTLSPELLLRLCGLKSLLFTHLDESQAGFGLQGERPEPGLKVLLPEGGDAYWAALRQSDKRFVSDTERRARKLTEQHGPIRLTFRNADPGELAFLIERKRDQYRRTGAGDVLEEPGAKELLRDLFDADHPLCSGILTTLHAGEVWVASHFGLRCRDTLHFWFPVYNPDLQSLSPGRLLVMAIIQQADALGLRRFDRGAGDSPAKRDFANHEHTYSRGLWQLPGPSAFLSRAAMAAVWRLRKVYPVRQGKVT